MKNFTNNTVFYAFLLALFSLTACKQTKQFKTTQTTDTIEAWESFKNDWPKSKKLDHADSRLQILYEERDWKLAQEKGGIAVYESFLNNYPDGLFKTDAKKLLAVQYEERDWDLCKRLDSKDAYQNFEKEYPLSSHLEELKEALYRIEVVEAWGKINWNATISSLEEFISKYPNTQEAGIASAQIEYLTEKQDVKKILKTGTVEECEMFLTKYPKGFLFNAVLYERKYLEEQKEKLLIAKAGNRVELYKEVLDFERPISRARFDKAIKYLVPYLKNYFNKREYYSAYAKEAEAAIQKLDESAWENAKRKNTMVAYEKYQEDFVNGSYVAEAKNGMKTIIEKEINRLKKGGKYGEMPPMQAMGDIFGGYEADEATITVENGTDYTMTVRYAGPSSKKIVFKPKETKTFNLDKGSYTVAASVKAANVQNYIGDQTLRGTLYSSKFYISTSFLPGLNCPSYDFFRNFGNR